MNDVYREDFIQTQVSELVVDMELRQVYFAFLRLGN